MRQMWKTAVTGVEDLRARRNLDQAAAQGEVHRVLAAALDAFLVGDGGVGVDPLQPLGLAVDDGGDGDPGAADALEALIARLPRSAAE